MSKKIVKEQKLNASMYLELNDNEAEALQGGRKVEEELSDKATSSNFTIFGLVLLFANPFS